MVDSATGKYSAEKWTASFVGFVPADHPRIVVAVVLHEPTLGHHGGDLAGPVFRRVAEASLRYLGVTPSSSASAVNLASVRHEADLTDPSPSMPRPSVPIPGAPTPSMAAVPPGSVRVPDATGLPAHDVVVSLTKAGLVPRIEGWGRAVRQEPPAGSAALKGASVRVVFEPAS